MSNLPNEDSNETYTTNETNMIKVMLETDWSEGAPYEWFIGVMLGTDEYFNETEKNMLTEKCNEIILQHLSTLPKKRVDQMLNKARSMNPTFMEKFGKKTYNYDDEIVKGEK